MTTFHIVHSGGVTKFEADTVEEAVTQFDYRGYTLAPMGSAFVRNTYNRAELQGQPRFAALNGPMWGGTTSDGQPIIRYESSAVYVECSK